MGQRWKGPWTRPAVFSQRTRGSSVGSPFIFVMSSLSLVIHPKTVVKPKTCLFTFLAFLKHNPAFSRSHRSHSLNRRGKEEGEAAGILGNSDDANDFETEQ